MNSHWRDRRERGSDGAIRLIIWLALHVGRGLCRVLLVPICVYFFATAPQTRRASQQFLSRAMGRPATWGDTIRHLLVFSTTLLDRIYLFHGRQRELDIEVSNEKVFSDAIAAGRGCLLLGSHLGSFEMLGIVGSVEKKLAINMVMHVDDGARLASLIRGEQLALPYKIIPLGQPGSMLQVKECLDRGEVVGILADRVYAGEATQSFEFMGQRARFSLSPFRLAKVTGAPVVAVFGLFRGGRRYEIVFETLAERVDDERTRTSSTPSPALSPRTKSLRDCQAAYVSSLERHARQTPYNWFNFYDYWSH
ncbi:MAG: lipid A biosynthesis acyltransferase [Betaproteobacteria bacterium]